VTAAGDVSYTAIDPTVAGGGHTVPAGYAIQPNQPAYDAETAAAVSGGIDVCISGINEFDEINFNKLRLLHAEGSAWADRTTYAVFRKRRICARVDSLSAFLIAATDLTPTANATASGRITRGFRPIGGAIVSAVDASGTIRTGRANPFGYFRINGLPAGQSYAFSVAAKGYAFTPQTLTIHNEVTNFDFIAHPRGNYLTRPGGARSSSLALSASRRGFGRS
jgi:hypothetical protein